MNVIGRHSFRAGLSLSSTFFATRHHGSRVVVSQLGGHHYYSGERLGGVRPLLSTTTTTTPTGVCGSQQRATISSKNTPDPADLELWGEAADRYKVHPETALYGRRLGELGVGSYGHLPMELYRAQALRVSEALGGNVQEFEGTEKNFSYNYNYKGTQATVHGAVYIPKGLPFFPNMLVYFHGGGLLTGSRNTHAAMLKTIASMAKCSVINVEYRLAPEHKFPASFYDAYFIVQKVFNNPSFFGGHPDSHIGVGGDGVGSLLAANVACDFLDIHFQILLCPMTSLEMSSPSFVEFNKTPGLNTDTLIWQMREWQGSRVDQGDDLLLTPAQRHVFLSSHLDLCLGPRALLVVAQLDPLRDQALEYFETLLQRKVQAELMMVEGAPHGFLTLPGHFVELTKEPYDRIASFLRECQ